MKNELEISPDIINDLVYCRRAINNHIIIHQKITKLNAPPQKIKKMLQEIEREIMDIGEEQKLLFNRLRYFMDYHLLSRNAEIADRLLLTNLMRAKLLKHENSNDDDIQPKNVQQRMSNEKLYSKYIRMDDINSESLPLNGDVLSSDTLSNRSSSNEAIEKIVSIDNNHMNVKISVPKPMQTNLQRKEPWKSGESLLKPLLQRFQSQNDVNTESKQQPAAPIQLGRLKLKEALCKAKDAKVIKPSTDQIIHIKVDSPDTISLIPSPKSITTLSSSQSSNASSSEEMDTIKEADDIDDLNQEDFLRFFRLYTIEYSEKLKNRQPTKRKRNCTSTTARADFHQKNYDMFEKQYANKRNKKQFLYSPPATRARRRFGGNNDKNELPPIERELVVIPKKNKTIKSNASSSSSISSNGSNQKVDKVCLKCYKRNNLLECLKCNGRYHADCHTTDTENILRGKVCPDCCRPKLTIDQGRRTYIK